MATQHEELHAFVAAVRRRELAAVAGVLEQSAYVRDHINDPLFDFGQRALHLAANSADLVDLLLAFGADIELRSAWQNGPYTVLDNADASHARHLLSRGARLTPHVASRLGWFDELRQLVDASPAVVHERGGDGQQPLHQAQTVDIADYLLERGAGIDTPCTDHQSTPAQYALVDRTPVCLRLLERGARPDIFMAAWLGDIALADRLIDADASSLTARINRPGYTAVPPFNIYCWTLGFLLSPHEVARSKGHSDLYERLLQLSPVRVRFLDAAFSGSQARAAAALAEDPSLVSSLTDDDHGQLALAIFFDRLTAAHLMLDLGFNPAAKGTDNGTALHAACWIGDVDLVERILAMRVVPVESRDDTHGSTPLGWAAFGSVHRASETGDYPAVIERLVAAGADIHAPGNRHRHTLVDMAEGNVAVQQTIRRLAGGR